MSPLPLQTSHSSEKLSTSPAATFFLVISTKPSLEISKTCVLVLSLANSCLNLFKRLARVDTVLNSKSDKNGVNIIVGVDTVTLYFNKDVNLHDQKLKILNRTKDLESKMLILMKKLENKSFLLNAPKSIVQKEKDSLIKNKIELKKLNSILNSIKN